MKRKVLLIILSLFVLLTSCTKDVETSGDTSPFVSENDVSDKFLSVFNEIGLKQSTNEKNVKTIAKNISLSGGTNLYESGLLFESEDLYGTGYGYGESDNYISYNFTIRDKVKTETYSVYISKRIEGVALPGDLEFGSSFKSALDEFSILDKFNEQNDGTKAYIECFAENGESIYINLKSKIGKIINNDIDTATATIVFEKEINEIHVTCDLRFNDGKLVSVNYTLSQTSRRIKNFTNDKIVMKFHKRSVSNNEFEAKINSILFKADTANLTVTVKSKTGKKVSGDITIYGMISDDQAETVGKYSFEADKNEKKLTLKSELEAGLDYFNDYFECDEYDFYVYNGMIRYSRLLSSSLAK